MTIRPLRTEDIIAAAREQAESGAPMAHDYEAGSAQAAAFEHHYQARRIELETVEA